MARPQGQEHNRPAVIATLKEDDEIYFLPPRSFLKQYSLLVEAVYLTRQPEPEVKHWMKRGGVRLPVRNYAAYRRLRQADQKLYEMGSGISSFMNPREE